MSTFHSAPAPVAKVGLVEQVRGIVGYGLRAIGLVWTTSRPLTASLAVLTVIAGILPAGTAWVGKLIVDAVVAAHRHGYEGAHHCG